MKDEDGDTAKYFASLFEHKDCVDYLSQFLEENDRPSIPSFESSSTSSHSATSSLSQPPEESAETSDVPGSCSCKDLFDAA